MAQLLRNKKLILAILLIAALLPYFIICFYAYPFADDFGDMLSAMEKISFADKFLKQYLGWSGRYSSDILVNLNPLLTGRIIGYQLVLFASLIGTTIIIYFFTKQILKNRFNSFLCALFFTLFFLNYQPNLTEGVYWYDGVTGYLLGNLCFLLQLVLFSKIFSSNGKRKTAIQATSLLLLIAAIGFNEIGALLIPLFYIFASILTANNENLNKKNFQSHCVVALLASAFVFFAPGNFVRINNFEGRYDLLHSVFYSTLQTIRFIGTWFLSVSFVAISLLIVANADKFRNKFLLQIDFRMVGFFFLLTVFTGSFLPYFATGILGQHRTINYVFFYFILLWIIFLLSVSEKFLLFKKMNRLKNESAVFVLLTISILTMAASGNGWKIIKDFRQHNFKKYETAFFERQKLILENPESSIPPLSIIPNTFQITDTKNDTAYWVDKSIKLYYQETKKALR